MNPLRAAPFLVFVALLATSCSRRDDAVFQGYIEGEFVHVAAPVPGALVEVFVKRGDRVEAGAPLFALEAESERAAVEEAGRRVRELDARVENLRKGLRPTELDAARARADQARANLDGWTAELARREKLYRDQVISAAELDQVRTQTQAAQAAFNAARADLATGRLGAREDEVRAAEAEREALAAALARARWALDQKTQNAPAAGVIHDVLYRPGEFLPAGTPAVALLPPENIRVRFFAPQHRLPALQPGTAVEVLPDGEAQPAPAVVNYVSTDAEFTPPVIFGRETRAKLVFMIEASFTPDVAARLRPGQPVDVRLPSPPP